MRRVFADALYWIALANPHDHWHEDVLAVDIDLVSTEIVTTEEVLTELLAALAGAGEHRRDQAVEMILNIFAAPNVIVIPQSHGSFIFGIQLYQNRSDKQYSLTDCISMNTCRAESITEVLTNDHHFTQEGFTILLSR